MARNKEFETALEDFLSLYPEAKKPPGIDLFDQNIDQLDQEIGQLCQEIDLFERLTAANLAWQEGGEIGLEKFLREQLGKENMEVAPGGSQKESGEQNMAEK